MTLLLLAGTGEARRIAWRLADKGRDVVATMAGVTRLPEPLPVETVTGGFGGEAGFRDFLQARGISAVLDATHPFAHRITDRTARVCETLDLPYAQVLRPPWEPQGGDLWTFVNTPEEVAEHVPADAVVFLATGRQTLTDFAGLAGRRVLARMVDPPTAPFPFEGGEFVIGRPPFPVERERALFRTLGVTHLVVKNAGGAGGRAKLDAARALGLPVILLNRPAMPQARRFEGVDEAVSWALAL